MTLRRKLGPQRVKVCALVDSHTYSYIHAHAHTHTHTHTHMHTHTHTRTHTHTHTHTHTGTRGLKPYVELNIISPNITTRHKRKFATRYKATGSPSFNESFRL